MGVNYGTVSNCTVSGRINAVLDMEHILDCGGIVGDNLGTVSDCTFVGEVYSAVVGGITGANGGTVKDCWNISGRVSTGGSNATTRYSGGIIGHLYTNTGNYNNVRVEGNTYSTATGQQYGIGHDRRLSPAGPSNSGTTQVN